MLTSSDIIFVGKGASVVSWYRTGMPSFHLGCDWVAMVGKPPHLRMDASLKRGGNTIVSLDDYKIVILQQPSGKEWLYEIFRLRKKGIRVVYEVDDYLHGVRKVKGHRAALAYSKKLLPEYEICMQACDAMIVSTPWLAVHYRKFNNNIYLCRNGIDTKRYGRFERPKRDTINIGWAGGEGHLESVSSWLPAVAEMLDKYENARFISMGLPVAGLLKRPKQAIALPFISIENFAPALCNFDIAIAPAGRSNFFAAKSDLRFLETGALAIPIVADPFVYNDIRQNETGLLAEDVTQATMALDDLMASKQLRDEIGYNARDYVCNNRDIENVLPSWERVFMEIA